MIFAVLIVLFCALLALWNKLKPRGPSPPVYPGALPILGHAHQLYGDPIHFWVIQKKMYQFSLDNGGVSEIRFGPHSVYMVTDPDDSLVVANTCLNKPYYYEFAKEMFNRGLVTASLTTWKPHRRLLYPAFNMQVLATFVSEYNTQARNLVKALTSEVGKEPFNVRHYLVNQLLKTVCQTSLGLETKDKSIDEDYANATEDLFMLFVERLKKLYLHLPWIFAWSSLKARQDQLLKIMNDAMFRVIDRRKAELKGNVDKNKTDIRDVKFKPLLDQLLELSDTQDALSDAEIREHLDTVVAAAYDTTSIAVTYALILLGTYPEVQDRAYKEVQSVLGDEDKDFSKDDLQRLVYLEAVLKESMRMYPSVPCVARSIEADVKLKNYTLPAGASCMISIYGLNHHAIWGPDVDQFKPERWLDPSTLPDNPNVFCSFSIGKRNCLGRLYAMLVMKTMLAHVLRKFLIISDINSITTQYDILIKPADDSQIRLELRSG
ncbi:cytochrome P450 4C1-like [Spodoptera litura]|uniref:Cytochrome P450 4C1-like n=1 Tax=Spodoptera litura TaxID=69820 RepID=A0A9J7EAJ1_SPOLT|nr:cytochrome P450 4C1-like [Spodoptera litura]